MSTRKEKLAGLIDAGSTDPFVHYAYALEFRAEPREACRLLRDVADRFPSYVPTYLMAATCAQEAGDEEVAAALAERGVEVAQKQGDGHAVSELRALLMSLG